ncbi:hypothetical protein DXG03_002223 [Asterophora parasitica]|uniref:Uncharacterized protein n=1 Tax=Asterophora parasitica TaxID=117018 RepID=A0A9P7KGH4_9AGAR|nr:hypothetical protein DXG03_002223 [Asterophora parasitica]
MKNTLIRGVNNVYSTAPLVTNNKFTPPFLRYVVIVIEILRLHLEGDQLFFTKINVQGKSIVDVLGIANSYLKDYAALLAFLQGMQQMLQKWTKTPQKFSPGDLQGSLGTLSSLMLRHMESQRKALSKDYLMKYCSDKELRDMITGESALSSN